MRTRNQAAAEQAAIDRGRAEADLQSSRFADLQLDWVNERGELLARFGGRFDRKARQYIGDAPVSRRIVLHAGQEDAAVEFDRYMAVHLGQLELPEGEEPLFAWLLSGGRRGGKTFFLICCAIAYAITVPDAIVWIACPSDSFYNEPIDYLEELMPSSWYIGRGWPWWQYDLPNGSRIILRSSFKAQKQKKGRADFVAVNEGQQTPQSSMTALSGATVDNGGLLMVAANPPDVGDKGEWVADMAAEARGAGRGERVHERHDFFDPMENPHINHKALMALAARMSKHEFDVQVRGKFLSTPDAVLHAWDRGKDGNEIPVPQLAVDVTAEFTKHKEGRAYEWIVGVDVQNYPWTVGVVFKVFRNPAAPADLERAFLWAVGEVYVEQGDEVNLCAELRARGLDSEQTLVICDSSGDWQQQQRDESKQRAQYKGKGSHDMFRGEGFRHVVGTDYEMRDNPDVIDRCRAANSKICNAKDERYVFADPVECKRTVSSIRKWKTGRNGRPSRYSKHAHSGDAFTYVIWRFFPRRKQTEKVEIKTFKRLAGRDRFKGY
jgi:hypothetical protein